MSSVRIREVGPRDGIQSESAQVATEDKVALIDALSGTGLRSIEAVSFVSPKAIPNMADARAVWDGITRRKGVFYSALVPNRKGAEAAADAGVDGMQVFIAASDSYNLRNVRSTVKESIPNVESVVEVAGKAGIPVEGSISTAFGCPYEGDVPPERVVEVTRWMVDAGISSISYGDTTGMGTPRRVREVVEAVRLIAARSRDQLAFPRHTWDRSSQRGRCPGHGHRVLRCLHWRYGRKPLCRRCYGQHCHRGPRAHA